MMHKDNHGEKKKEEHLSVKKVKKKKREKTVFTCILGKKDSHAAIHLHLHSDASVSFFFFPPFLLLSVCLFFLAQY